MSSAMNPPQRLSEALLSFAQDGQFPEDIDQVPPLSDADLTPAIEALDQAKVGLDSEIHLINEETKEEVSSWVKNAKLLQEDIIRSKDIANDIVRQSEAPDTSGELIEDAEEKVQFLSREVNYSQQLYSSLDQVQHVRRLLAEVKEKMNDRRMLDSIRLLEVSRTAIGNIGVSKSSRVVKLLHLRANEINSTFHSILNQAWHSLIEVSIDNGRVTIHEKLPDDRLLLSEVAVGFKAFNELDERVEQLWRNIDAAVIRPRMDKTNKSNTSLRTSERSLKLDSGPTSTVASLLDDLETALIFLASTLPPDLIQALSTLMGDLIPRLIQQWLTPAIPSSLGDMAGFQAMINRTKEFCENLDRNGYTALDELQDWVGNTPLKWLERYRAETLDSIRRILGHGIGNPKEVEKIEKHMVSISEGNELAASGAGATADTTDWGDDWGDAWAVDDEKPTESGPTPSRGVTTDNDDGGDAWGWGDEDGADPTNTGASRDTSAVVEDDDLTAAWDLDDDNRSADEVEQPASTGSHVGQHKVEQTRELVLKEVYNISSLPEPVLALIMRILEEAADLTREGNDFGKFAGTAPGLFGLPTFALAMFRATSPQYYSRSEAGNMFLYNDAMYLAEELTNLSARWKQRDDIGPRAKTMLRLDNDIKSLQHFANRSYAAEMNVQKTVLRDLLGGGQSLMQDKTESSIETGTSRVRMMAELWEPILARSVWSQAVGSLSDTIATKLITDVLEMSSIGQDEAYNIATLIAKATELDDLFLPSKLAGSTGKAKGAEGSSEVPTTAQYASHWLRLKFLSEVLQSNLNEVKYLWRESELSLYFSREEVVDLINASFEDNARTRETIKEVMARR